MKRRNLLAAAAVGGLGAVLGGTRAGAAAAEPNSAAPAAAPGNPVVPSPVAPSVLADSTVEPEGGAGLFDVDPDQGNVSQSPDVVVTGDVAVMPEDWEF